MSLTLGPGSVGRRVVLRHRVPRDVPGGGPGDASGEQLTDVLGELLAWGEGRAVVRTRTGAEVVVDLDSVVAGKEVPPAPARRGPAHLALGVESLEDVMSDGWRPLERDLLGRWLLRASDGFTGRGNSALPLGDPGVPLEEALDAVERWYDARRLPSRVSVPWPLDAPALPDGARDVPLDAALRARGYELDTPTLVLTAPLAAVAGTAAPSDLPGDLVVRVDDEPDDGWLSLYRYRGQDLPPVARRVLVSAPSQAFASVRTAHGETVAVGRVAVSRGWAGVTAMDVAGDHRRRGLGRVVLATLARWGLDQGARSAYLQVAEANEAARALYDAAGFEPHHGYHYRVGRTPS